ncbi:Pectic acid lyase [Planctomycetes bacterium Pan216]|uniref:Pectic acid lyase n=1 Tax=Kolteria novifilia TaxID=2527975 RepID=A0A518B3Y2_9BACT|nr:Pectic acid lyase [Planctomycetes bacterium Pan216]
MRFLFLSLVATLLLENGTWAADRRPTQQEAEQALSKAVDFFTASCEKHGGYVWRYSKDLRLSEGEAETGPSTVWVQPPGTPAVGMALLRAYRATGDRKYLQAAKRTGDALVKGQLQSGGWFYSIHFDPETRKDWGYRDNTSFRASRKKKNKTNITTLDDDTTPAAVRFLAELDQELDFKDRAIHESVLLALEALMKAQYPNGGWSQKWHRYPEGAKESDYPVINASYPEEWPRKWLNDWRGKYYLNDNVTGNMVETFLLAGEIYQDNRYVEVAKRAGEFLILAQMPDPQPAWAQQYDENMHPVWDRKFEPPAISGRESEEAMESLLLLYEKTGDERFLKPIPAALRYLRSSLRPDGKLARFYELKTNRPLYFVVDGKRYDLTYSDRDLPTHYGFVVDAHLDKIESRYRKLLRDRSALSARRRGGASRKEAERVRKVIDQMDERGAWVDPRTMKGFRKASPEGVIQSDTFIDNVELLSDYIQGMKERS